MNLIFNIQAHQIYLKKGAADRGSVVDDLVIDQRIDADLLL
jgi:hypothetical protein